MLHCSLMILSSSLYELWKVRYHVSYVWSSTPLKSSKSSHYRSISMMQYRIYHFWWVLHAESWSWNFLVSHTDCIRNLTTVFHKTPIDDTWSSYLWHLVPNPYPHILLHPCRQYHRISLHKTRAFCCENLWGWSHYSLLQNCHQREYNT
jgi:hypothetical protein